MIFGGLFVLALTAALVVPYFVDWSSYRAGFEREASAILGRKVTVHGEATATILPFPSVTFSDVEVAGGPDGVATWSFPVWVAPDLGSAHVKGEDLGPGAGAAVTEPTFHLELAP